MKRVCSKNIYKVYLIATLLTGSVHCSCAPEAVKDDLQQCLQNNDMGTYYQFPILPETSYHNLCFNVTCLSYCMTLVASPCSSLESIIHIGNGDALSAAYLGLCDQTETDVKAALTCGNMVSNQDALNAISLFQTSLESSYAASSENTTVICSEWVTMKGTLDTLISGRCSGTSLTIWQTFLNTVTHECDDTLTPSWYADYRETSNTRCSGATSVKSHRLTGLHILCVIIVWACVLISRNKT